ncbi:phosphotransferase [Williamsia sp. SKLECPSW1]
MTGAVGDHLPPDAVLAVVGGRPVVPVWRNDAGGVTYAVGTPPAAYLKWQPDHPAISPYDEFDRLAWAVRQVAVPEPLDRGSCLLDDGTAVSWLLTRAIPASSAVDPRWSSRGRAAARAVGEGLRRFHEGLPVDDCPWSWSPTDRIADARRRGVRVPAELETPPVEDRVVCHGDACCPNTLVDDCCRAVAHVDLGRLGVADRWADLAVAAMSAGWNFGADLEDEVYAGYGIEADPVRIGYYRRLWVST